MTTFHHRPGTWRRSRAWCLAAAAWGAAAAGHALQAGGHDAPVQAAAHVAPQPLGPAPSTGAWDSALYSAACQRGPHQHELRRRLQLVQLQLKAQGLDFRVQGCSPAANAPRTLLWVQVGVWVRDSEVAARFVRGMLVDGEMLDVQPEPPPVPDAALAQAGAQPEDVSPDVHFNRQWLARTMRAQGLAPVPGQWWTFVWGRRGT